MADKKTTRVTWSISTLIARTYQMAFDRPNMAFLDFSLSGLALSIQSLWPVVTLVGVVFSTITVASFIAYRLYFHPYARYPGPLLARLTSWYSVYHTYIGDTHVDQWRCHEKYGDVVRYCPNRLLINTSTALKEIYGHGKNVCKSKSYHRISLVKGVEATQSVVDKQTHGKLRRILNQGLSDTFIRTLDHELIKLARLLADRLGEKQDDFSSRWQSPCGDDWTCPKNMAHWCDYFMFDVMSQLVFGLSFDMLDSDENHWLIDAVIGQLRRISFLTQLPELEDLRMHHVLFPDARKKAFKFSMKSREIMEARKAMGDKPTNSDIVSKLLTATDTETGEKLSPSQLWAESNLLIIAGSDTSSTGMAAAYFYLSRNTSAYDQAMAEVRSTFRPSVEVTQGPSLTGCTYLRACITEALRLCPPASAAMWREVLPGGLAIADMHIPAGYDVGTGIYSLNHNAEYYPEPFKFSPERWIPEIAGKEAVEKAKSAFNTFSMGPRNCVGKGLAMIEISLALATVMVQYDFRIAEGDLGLVGEGKGAYKSEYQTFWAFTSIKDGPYIQFKKRAS